VLAVGGVDSCRRLAYDLSMNVVITGGNRGIGLALARLLDQDGHQVFIGCRAAASASAGASTLPLDLASPESIAQFVATLPGRSVDVLVNNAGAMFAARELTAALVERTLAVNCVGPLQLTETLKPRRVFNVVTSPFGRVDLDDLTRARSFSTMSAYLAAKLAMMHVGRVWAAEGMHVTSMHPGMVRTPMLDAPGLGGGIMRYLTPLLHPLAAEPEIPARALRRLILDEGAGDALFHRSRRVDWPGKLRDPARNAEVTTSMRALAARR
jgi:NAD(P)-dependent dehydrogenase (short-subunit alcohol dehydrogenase family)